MSNVSAIAGYNTGTHTSTTSSASNTQIEMNDYLKLLVAQLSNQDATSPMDTDQMVAQLAQMATVEAMSSFKEMSNNTYATGLLGKEVTVVDTDVNGRYQGYATGIVSGVSLYNGSTQIMIGDKSYSLSQVMTVNQTETTGNSSNSTSEAATGPASAIETSSQLPKKDVEDDEELDEALDEKVSDTADDMDVTE